MRMNYRELINREIADTLISLFRSILTSGRLPDCLKDFHEHDIAWAMSCSWKYFWQSGSLPEVRMLRNREKKVSAILRLMRSR